MSTATNDQPATSRQLTYLKALAERTGQTFSWPSTRAQASAEIARLKRTPGSTRTECAIEQLESRAICEAADDAADVHEFEVIGYGSSATWSQRS
jgi:hypothetical protein